MIQPDITPHDNSDEDQDVPQMALDALAAAHQRARRSQQTIVFVENGKLIEQGPSGRTILKSMPSRVHVTQRIKRSKS